MELQIKAYQAQPIEWNYEALKTELLSKLEDYKHLQYTAEQITMAKADRANLNNLKKALSDERIRRKKEFLEPFETFEKQVKELCNLIDEPVQLIDTQIKEVEEKEKLEIAFPSLSYKFVSRKFIKTALDQLFSNVFFAKK